MSFIARSSIINSNEYFNCFHVQHHKQESNKHFKLFKRSNKIYELHEKNKKLQKFMFRFMNGLITKKKEQQKLLTLEWNRNCRLFIRINSDDVHGIAF